MDALAERDLELTMQACRRANTVSPFSTWTPRCSANTTEGKKDSLTSQAWFDEPTWYFVIAGSNPAIG